MYFVCFQQPIFFYFSLASTIFQEERAASSEQSSTFWLCVLYAQGMDEFSFQEKGSVSSYWPRLEMTIAPESQTPT